MRRSGQIQRRKRIKAKRREVRRGRITDAARLDWAVTVPCQVTGEFPATTHHVRSYGSPKDDTRIVRLVPRLHMKTEARAGIPCVEDGKFVFEEFHGVSIETLVGQLRQRYEREIA